MGWVLGKNRKEEWWMREVKEERRIWKKQEIKKNKNAIERDEG